MVQKTSHAYLRTESFNHIGFETKQEMKPYYNIVHKTFKQPKCSDIHVAENQHK